MVYEPAEDRKVRWTSADLKLFPDDGKRYEIIDGELFVTRAPHWKHQKACVIYRLSEVHFVEVRD
jgi:hypothetical protein